MFRPRPLLLLVAALAYTLPAGAIPAPYSPEELEAAATLIVAAEVSAVECLGEPLITELPSGGTKILTSYRSTLTVLETTKGTAPEVLTIDGSTSEFTGGGFGPVGGWQQPAYAVGTKGTFYLEPDSDSDGGYKIVWWNGLLEADASILEELPDCSATCTPNCDSKNCGDDGCGNSCGVCDEGFSCVGGACEAATACVPNCVDAGGETMTCGDDGCGGSCGECAAEETCNANGFCTQNACDPVCDDQACGDDLCGGSCGECAEGETCSEDGQCAACEPQCTKENDGETIPLNCGDDGCGGSCGSCSDPSFCESGQCTAVPCDPASVPGETMCGPNGCGGDWGDCPDTQSCGPMGYCIEAGGTTSDDTGGTTSDDTGATGATSGTGDTTSGGSGNGSGGGCQTGGSSAPMQGALLGLLCVWALWMRPRAPHIDARQ